MSQRQDSGAPLFERIGHRLPNDAGALLFVTLVWLTQSYLLLDFVKSCGTRLPHYDEWEMIPALMGAQKISLGWLWTQHNEHRIFLPRLVYLLVEWLSGMDFRAGMFFDAGLLSLCAAACCLIARWLRAAASYADAFFPLVLLHWGQCDNLMWSFQIAFVLPSALLLLVLLLLVQPGTLRFSSALALGLCTAALPLTGGAGLALVPALGLCTLWTAWELRREGESLKRWLSVLGTSGLGFVLTACYFIGYVRPAKHPVSPGLEATARATVQILTTGFGSGSYVYWPDSGYLLGALALATAVLLVLRLVRGGEERSRALRLGLFLGGMVSLAGGIAWARVALYPQGIFQSRYVTLVVPFLCAIYFAWGTSKRTQLGQFMQMTLCFVTLMLVVRNREHGYGEAMAGRALREVVLSDVRSGITPAELVRRHCSFLYYVCDDPRILTERVSMLRDARVGDFARLGK